MDEHEDPQLKLVRRRDGGPRFTLRIAASLPLFALAVFSAVRSWYPIREGYFSDGDNPDGAYLTVAATGVAIAAMFAAAGLLVAWPSFRRYGGFFLLAAAAVAASLLPYLLFKWTTEPETWPWLYLVQNRIGWLVPNWFGWLDYAPRSRSIALKIQSGLAIVAAAAVAAQLLYWWIPSRGRRAGTGIASLRHRHADPSP